jgi:hypothetical protein
MSNPALRRATAASKSIAGPLSTAPDGPDAGAASWIVGGAAGGRGFFFLAAMMLHCTAEAARLHSALEKLLARSASHPRLPVQPRRVGAGGAVTTIVLVPRQWYYFKSALVFLTPTPEGRMNAVRIRKHLQTDTVHLPELRHLLGRTVEFIVLDDTPPTATPPLETAETFFERLPPVSPASPADREAELRELRAMARDDLRLAAFLDAAAADCIDVAGVIGQRGSE